MSSLPMIASFFDGLRQLQVYREAFRPGIKKSNQDVRTRQEFIMAYAKPKGRVIYHKDGVSYKIG